MTWVSLTSGEQCRLQSSFIFGYMATVTFSIPPSPIVIQFILTKELKIQFVPEYKANLKGNECIRRVDVYLVVQHWRGLSSDTLRAQQCMALRYTPHQHV